jgi:hypothetical protein
MLHQPAPADAYQDMRVVFRIFANARLEMWPFDNRPELGAPVEAYHAASSPCLLKAKNWTMTPEGARVSGVFTVYGPISGLVLIYHDPDQGRVVFGREDFDPPRGPPPQGVWNLAFTFKDTMSAVPA